MNEDQIATQLKATITQPDTEVAENVQQGSNQVVNNDYELDEMTQYKLHDLFGQPYQSHNEVNRQRLTYIYEEVAKMIDSREYGFIAAKISDIQRMIGISDSNDRLYRLYQWLRLNNVRKNAEAEMESLRGVDSDVGWRQYSS